jgi:hypothetical protein
VRDKYLDAITAAVRQLPDDASPQDCERAASEAIHAARLAALPAEPTDPYTIAVVEGLPYELEVGGKRGGALWWRLTTGPTDGSCHTWLDLCDLGTPVVLRRVPPAPRPGPYTGLTQWTWQASGSSLVRVWAARRGQIELAVGSTVDGLSPAAARQLAAVLLDQADAGDRVTVSPRGKAPDA